MTLEEIRLMLAWTSLINIFLLMYWFAMIVFANDWVYRCHTKWFKVSKEKFDEMHYLGLMYFKITVIVFHLVPYLALRWIFPK